MAAKTTSGSGFDRIFRLFGPGFLLESEFIDACIEAVASGADKCAFCDFVKIRHFCIWRFWRLYISATKQDRKAIIHRWCVLVAQIVNWGKRWARGHGRGARAPKYAPKISVT